MDPFEKTRQIFYSESRDLLQQFEDTLLGLDLQAVDESTVNDLFRAMHTIKGSAGLLGFERVVGFAHQVESLLDRLRRRELSCDRELVNLLLECQDHALALIQQQQEGAGETAPHEEREQRLLVRLEAVAPEAEPARVPPPRATPNEISLRSESSGLLPDCWTISARFSEGILESGLDPLAMLDYLSTLGDLVHVALTARDVPPLGQLDPLKCHLGFDVALRTAADRSAIEGVFEFVRHDGQIRIIPPASKHAEYLEAIHSLPEGDCRLGEILVQVGAITRQELRAALLEQHRVLVEDDGKEAPRLGEVLVGAGTVAEDLVRAAVDRQGRDKKTVGAGFIRVPADKLDKLIGLVGELVVAGAGTNLLATTERNTAFMEATSFMQRLVEDIRSSALSLRMVQIGESFNRFNRVVWDMSQELGKSIRLEIEGAETELDKTVVEKLGDPLMHIVRNAMDHGIELPEVRAGLGKPEQATVKLAAYHDSGSIVVEVSDDGMGIDVQRVRRKAIERGMLGEDDHPSRQELLNLVFEPGFSTAARVSDLSGRGVGMDVVRQNIEALRGTVDLDTREREGTTVRIRVPLTLAIIDGFLVGVGRSRFVVPLDVVAACIELTPEQQATDSNSLNLRGEVLPFVRLRQTFGLPPSTSSRQSVVVVRHGGTRAGLVVDTLLGELQTVIKPLSTIFGHLPGIAGSSVLGGGEVALIIDVPTLVAGAIRKAGGKGRHCQKTAEPVLGPT